MNIRFGRPKRWGFFGRELYVLRLLDRYQERKRGKQTCFAVRTLDGHMIRINGDPNMPPATLEALMALADLSYQQYGGEIPDE
jgi:hypothetical protein